MINLIHPDGYKNARREYWFRVVTVWFFLFSLVCMVFTLLLVPSYVLVNSHLAAIQNSNAIDADVQRDYHEAEEYVKEANHHVKQLSKPQPRTLISEVVDVVVSHTPNGIRIRAYEITREEGNLHTFMIQGTAETRDKLAQFRLALERAALFEKVELPISDLARSIDLPFVMTVTIADIKQEKNHD